MFICDACLKASYRNAPTFHRSRGACEVCRKVDNCNDIPSRMLVSISKPGMVRVELIAVVGDEEVARVENEVPEELASEIVAAALVQVEEPDLELARRMAKGPSPAHAKGNVHLTYEFENAWNAALFDRSVSLEGEEDGYGWHVERSDHAVDVYWFEGKREIEMLDALAKRFSGRRK